jgi:hypothetical protein
MEYKMCILISSTNFVWNIYHSKNWAQYDKMCIGLYVKYPVYLLVVKQNHIFSTDFQNSQILIFTKIRLVGAELFHADRRTDRKKLIIAFHNFSTA